MATLVMPGLWLLQNFFQQTDSIFIVCLFWKTRIIWE